MEGISLSKYLKIIFEGRKVILYFTLVMMLLALIYGIFVYKPIYKSSAKLLLKLNTPTTFITPLEIEDGLSNITPNKNPILTQIEIISSMDMSREVYKKLNKDFLIIDVPENKLIKALNKAIKLENPPMTDIIKIEIYWTDALYSSKIAKAYLDAYYDYNVSVNKKSVSQMRQYIEEQLAKSSKKLSFIKNQIKNYRKNISSIDIDKESSSIIDQIVALENNITETKSQLLQNRKKAVVLSRKLGINIDKAIKSQAVGQNANLSNLRQNLTDAEQKYASLNVKYPPTNPQVKELSANIEEIKKQIESQTRNLIGNYDYNKGIIIADPVRTDMVNQLVQSQIETDSLKSKKSSLESILAELKTRKQSLPEQQKNISSLLEEEKTLTNIVEVLNTKLIEAKIKESEIVSNINIVESPEVPDNPSFPTLFQVIIILTIMGILLGIAAVLGRYYIEDVCYGVEEIETILKSTVIGLIPWFDESNYQKSDNVYNHSSILGITYQKIISSLKIKCYKKNINVIAFSSAEFKKERSFISISIAKALTNTGHRVLLLDADFRNGVLAKEFNIDTSKYKDLTELLISLSSLEHHPEKEIKITDLLDAYVISMPEDPKLFFIPNNNVLTNPYELITNTGFTDFLKIIKTRYDFVLLDTPPILVVPDTIAISQYVDGLVLFCGVKTSRSALQKIRKLCSDNYIELLGVVARDTLNELEISENQYVKH